MNTICVSYNSIRLVFNRYYIVTTLYSITLVIHFQKKCQGNRVEYVSRPKDDVDPKAAKKRNSSSTRGRSAKGTGSAKSSRSAKSARSKSGKKSGKKKKKK